MSEVFIVSRGKENIRAEVSRKESGIQVSLNGKSYMVDALEVEKNVYSLLIEGDSFEAVVESDQERCNVYLPLTVHQTVSFQPMQSWVEGALFHLEVAFRARLQLADHLVAIHRFVGQQSQNHHPRTSCPHVEFSHFRLSFLSLKVCFFHTAHFVPWSSRRNTQSEIRDTHPCTSCEASVTLQTSM